MNKFFERYFFAIMFALIVFLFCFSINAHPMQKSMIEKFKPYSNQLSVIISDHWKDLPYKYFIAGQIEKESNWNPKAELKTSREYGIGLSQITVTSRYNNFLEATKRYKELQNWKWDNRFSVDYQLHFIVLQDKSNFTANKKLFSDDINRWAGALVSYNAGYGVILQRRALCKSTVRCDSTVWFGGLDCVHLKYEDNNLYNYKLYKLRNKYPEDIIFKLSPKYIGTLK